MEQSFARYIFVLYVKGKKKNMKREESLSRLNIAVNYPLKLSKCITADQIPLRVIVKE